MLRSGFARVDVTPPLGVHIPGYPTERIADNVLAPITASAVVFSDGKKTVAMITADTIGLKVPISRTARETIEKRTGVCADAILLCCTHTHTGPSIGDPRWPDYPGYNQHFCDRLADAVAFALNDLKPSVLSSGETVLHGVNFQRRFFLKDGTACTNPGRHNPEIDRPVYPADETLRIIRVTREGGKDILLVNFQMHADIVKGTAISPDYPATVRDTLERVLPDVYAAYFNGSCGDLAHVNVNVEQWLTDEGPEYAVHCGRAIAGAVLQLIGKLKPLEGDTVDYASAGTDLYYRMPKEEEVPWAKHVLELYEQGRQNELFEGDEYYRLQGPIMKHNALRILNLLGGPDHKHLTCYAIRFGPCAVSGAPGEPFSWIGQKVRGESGFDTTFYLHCCNGYEGYYPTKDAYEVGSYESKSSNFLSGCAEKIADASLEALNKIR